jgi:RND family efflux transporter MFP subunit
VNPPFNNTKIEEPVPTTDPENHSIKTDYWQQLQADTSNDVILKEKLEAWLALQTGFIPQLKSALLLSLDEPSNQLQPVAQWADNEANAADLLEIVNQVIEENKPLFVTLDEQNIAVALPLLWDTKIQAIIAVSLASSEQLIINNAMRHLRWGAGMLELLFRREQVSSQHRQLESFKHSVELLTEVAAEKEFFSASQRLTSMLAARFHCNWVAIGWQQRRMKVTAISHQTQQVNKMNLVRAIEDAMSEAVMMRESIVCHEQASANHPAHDHLLKSHQLSNVLTVPMFHNEQYLGAVCLERENNRSFSALENELVNDILQVLTPVLDDKKSRDRNIFLKFLDSINEQAKRLIGSRYYGRKLAVLAIILLSLILGLVKINYQVNADSSLQGAVVRMISAPFEGYIEAAPVRAGDRVEKDQLMIRLDDRDLRLERLNWHTKKYQLKREQQEAAAQHDRAEAKIKAAEAEQAQAKLELAESKLARTKLTAPFAGLVVEGDLSQRLGGLVQKGEVLMQLTPLNAYRIEIKVDEAQIDHVQVGQTGELLLRSLPDQPVSFVVSRITPVSEAKDGINYFTVEAQLDELPTSIRPGMEGIAKISAGQRSIFFVLTRSLTQWLRLTFWKWLP